MRYLTRALVALSDVPLGPDYYTKGQKFRATETDAQYLIAKGKAQDDVEPAAAASSGPVKLPAAEQPDLPEPVKLPMTDASERFSFKEPEVAPTVESAGDAAQPDAPDPHAVEPVGTRTMRPRGRPPMIRHP